MRAAEELDLILDQRELDLVRRGVMQATIRGFGRAFSSGLDHRECSCHFVSDEHIGVRFRSLACDAPPLPELQLILEVNARHKYLLTLNLSRAQHLRSNHTQTFVV